MQGFGPWDAWHERRRLQRLWSTQYFPRYPTSRHYNVDQANHDMIRSLHVSWRSMRGRTHFTRPLARAHRYRLRMARFSANVLDNNPFTTYEGRVYSRPQSRWVRAVHAITHGLRQWKRSRHSRPVRYEILHGPARRMYQLYRPAAEAVHASQP